MKFQQNLERDARLVAAAYAGGHDAALREALRLRLLDKPDDLWEHAKWLRQQPQAYIDKVAEAVDQILPPEVQ